MEREQGRERERQTEAGNLGMGHFAKQERQEERGKRVGRRQEGEKVIPIAEIRRVDSDFP